MKILFTQNNNNEFKVDFKNPYNFSLSFFLAGLINNLLSRLK